MHANISKETIKNTNICVVWRTCPHLDAKPRGFKCASMLYKTIKKEIIPTQFIEAPPMLVSIVKQFTGQEPMKSLVDECVKALKAVGLDFGAIDLRVQSAKDSDGELREEPKFIV